jgi:glycosyltransferase involved in cell wall biosynthesis
MNETGRVMAAGTGGKERSGRNCPREGEMGQGPLVSIIVTNHNYGRYLRESIESGLGQTYPHVEVIAVDDGSTDDSEEVLAQYSGKVKTMFKENGGMISALNVGYPLSHGEIVCFLDSDDALFSTAMERVVPLFRDPGLMEVDWPLRVVDQGGIPTGKIFPKSGHAWSRRTLDQLFPLPQEERRYGVDGYLWTIVPLFGRVEEIPEPLGVYRWHGENLFAGRSLEKRVRIGVEEFDFYYADLGKWCSRLGRPFDLEQCVRDSWFHRLDRSIAEIRAATPAGTTLILVDEEHWSAGRELAGRRVLSFPERDGHYWGIPQDDAAAISELERLREEGARFLVFVWSTFWWLDHFAGFQRYLRERFRCALENDRLVVFDLRS